MTDTQDLTPAAIARIIALGWKEVAETPKAPVTYFEDPLRCLHMRIYTQLRDQLRIIVEGSYFYAGTRRRYSAEPVVHQSVKSGWEMAVAIRDELRFLEDDGVVLDTCVLHRLTSGLYARRGRQSVVKEGYWIGRRAA